jgi:hypothetical protein
MSLVTSDITKVLVVSQVFIPPSRNVSSSFVCNFLGRHRSVLQNTMKTPINTTSMFRVLVQLTNIQHVKPNKDGGISTLDVFSLP